MIGQEEIQRVARQWQIQDYVIEKDHVLGWLLWGISQHPVLSQAWVLKGGCAIKKRYVDTHRYSQDLDFTVLPGAPWQADELLYMTPNSEPLLIGWRDNDILQSPLMEMVAQTREIGTLIDAKA